MRLLVLLLIARAAHADCYTELAARHVAFKKQKTLVAITGPLGGVAINKLVIDCSLAVSLDEAGRYLRGLGITSATATANGLAIDLRTFTGPAIGTLRVDRDYEQGLGDDIDCVGHPLTRAGALLKILHCQLVRSGLFSRVLSPDADGRDHFHLEVKPWRERPELRSSSPAIR